MTNENKIEPHEYFKYVKGSVKETDEESLKSQLNFISASLLKAKEVGQKSFVDKLSFYYSCIYREQILYVQGFRKYCLKEDISKFITKSIYKTDNGEQATIKIIDFDRYTRVIPPKNMEDIIKAKSLKYTDFSGEEKSIFDDFVVVYTDLSGSSMETSEERAYKVRNRDPIVFGYFIIENAGIDYERFYYITDWEDENCDLTFSKMIDKMKEFTQEPEKVISIDDDYLKKIVQENIGRMKDSGRSRFSLSETPKEKKGTFFSKFITSIKKFLYAD